MPPESERLSLEDIITIADNLLSAHARAVSDAEDTVTGIMARMHGSMPNIEPALQKTAASALEDIRVDWSAAKSALEDAANHCNLALHTFVTQADFLIRRYENACRQAEENKSTAAQFGAPDQKGQADDQSADC